MGHFTFFNLLCYLFVIQSEDALCGRTIILSVEKQTAAFKSGEEVRVTSLFEKIGTYREGNGGDILQSNLEGDEAGVLRDVVPASNGFVDAVVRAYNDHHDLVIRPDDVWIAIMTQFSLYVNGHAEELRSRFVAFDGRRELVAYVRGTLRTVDYRSPIDQITEQIGENLVDDSVRRWVIADFSTTTVADRVASQVVLMGAMQKYFEYKTRILCGIPRITIEGVRDDWVKIKRRIARLTDYGEDFKKWSAMLDDIVAEFVAVFDEPHDGINATEPRNLHFWQTMVKHESIGCGTDALSGWITAFCLIGRRGTWQGRFGNGDPWPVVEIDDLPPGYVAVPMIIDDNGTAHHSMLFAGHLAYSHRPVQRGARESTVDPGSCLRPRVVWAIALMNQTRTNTLERAAEEHSHYRMVASGAVIKDAGKTSKEYFWKAEAVINGAGINDAFTIYGFIMIFCLFCSRLLY